MTEKIHRCKSHGYAHLYTRCPQCFHQYCPIMWTRCPRTSWHPNHATTDEDRGQRHRTLEEARTRADG